MKTKLTLICALFLIIFACAKEESEVEKIETELSYSSVSAGSTISISVTETGSWSAESSQSWCTISSEYSSGSGATTMLVSVGSNTTYEQRSAIVTITGESSITYVTITQMAAVEGAREMTLIFHTLYDDSSDELLYISQERITEVLDYVNTIYNQEDNNFGVNFILATTDPDGNTLSEAGIDRVSVSTATIDVLDFMTDMNSSMVEDYLWDCDKYINIYTYYFDGYESTLGISFMPYTMTSDPIDGLVSGDYYLLNDPTYLHGVHLNAYFSNIDTTDETSVFDDEYDCDFRTTLAHELGHYLGLIHPFTESGETSCSGEDYCDDTPNYDRDVYSSYLSSLRFITSVDVLFERTSCDGSTFTATNVMDYGYNWYDGFTSDQNTRVNTVIDEAILVPGYKALATKVTKSSVGERPEPKYLICGDSGVDHSCGSDFCLHNH